MFSAAIIIGLFFGIFLGWATVAQMESAAIASGNVKVSSSRKEIQHLEGGIVQDIKVRDGDFVTAGDILVVLDETQRRAALQLYHTRWLDLVAREARLIAERDGLNDIVFPAILMNTVQSTDTTRDVVAVQRETFKNRQESLAGQQAMVRQQILQAREEISGLKEHVEATNVELSIVREDIENVSALLKQGYAQKPRLQELKRDATSIQSDLAKSKSRMAALSRKIAELNLQEIALETKFREQTLHALQDTQAQLADASEQTRAAADTLSRTHVVAPISGTIVNNRLHTVGGVIAPGATLMEIVPSNDRFVIEARINPLDIDVVREGLEARVHFLALSQRNQRPLEGVLDHVSADSLIDEQTGAAYYLAHVVLEDSPGNGGLVLHPGMQAEVMISTGKRTAMDYFMKPIKDSFRRALTES